jgi:hypothetical protein
MVREGDKLVRKKGLVVASGRLAERESEAKKERSRREQPKHRKNNRE